MGGGGRTVPITPNFVIFLSFTCSQKIGEGATPCIFTLLIIKFKKKLFGAKKSAPPPPILILKSLSFK